LGFSDTHDRHFRPHTATALPDFLERTTARVSNHAQVVRESKFLFFRHFFSSHGHFRSRFVGV
jgi:hypothetical protein